MEKNLKVVYDKLQSIEDTKGDTATAWKAANHYLDNSDIDSYFMSASGVTDGNDIIDQCENALGSYDEDDADNKDIRKTLQHHIDNIDPDALYEGEMGLDAYNRHPEAGGSVEDDIIPEADSDDIEEAFGQMKQSLIDFPERY